MALGNRVRTLRKRQKLTLEQLSERSGVDLGTISALENRDSMRSKYAPQLAEALGVPLEALLGADDAMPPPSSRKHEQEWPFRRIDINRILALSTDDLDEAEGDLLFSLQKIEKRSAKKSRMRKRSAA